MQRIRKKHILVVLFFLGFFAFSNYFMGFVSFGGSDEDTVSGLVVIQNPDAEKRFDMNIMNQGEEQQKKDEERRRRQADFESDKKKPNQPAIKIDHPTPPPTPIPVIEEIKQKPGDKQGAEIPVVEDINIVPKPAPKQGGEGEGVPVDENENIPIVETKPIIPETPEDKHGGDGGVPTVTDKPQPPKEACHYTQDRDYNVQPIVIGGRWEGKFEQCDIPCVGKMYGGDYIDAGGFKSKCSKNIYFTMENVYSPKGSYDIVCTTDLDSDVPLPYFNWVEYDFKRPIKPKTASAQVAALISNCGPSRRLNWMKEMMEAGVKIDSYGACMHNKDVPSSRMSRGGDYNNAKQELIATYKFTMAFENSANKDYVTEKLFGVLAAGSVPLYDGAPNGKMFGPSAKSMLFAEDFESPKKMAEYILYLDSNDTAYEEYLEWKRKGPSDDWTALVDIGNVHSSCRLCIHAADLQRKEVGPVKKGAPPGEPEPANYKLKLNVRERGKFWLRDIFLQDLTIDELKMKINNYIPHDTKSYLYQIYDLWEKNTKIITDDDVRKLKEGMELEVIFVIPQKWDQ